MNAQIVKDRFLETIFETGLHEEIKKMAVLGIRKMSLEQRREIIESVKYLEKYFERLDRIRNLSLAAWFVHDVAWQHELAAEREKLEEL